MLTVKLITACGCSRLIAMENVTPEIQVPLMVKPEPAQCLADQVANRLMGFKHRTFVFYREDKGIIEFKEAFNE